MESFFSPITNNCLKHTLEKREKQNSKAPMDKTRITYFPDVWRVNALSICYVSTTSITRRKKTSLTYGKTKFMHRQYS